MTHIRSGTGFGGWSPAHPSLILLLLNQAQLRELRRDGVGLDLLPGSAQHLARDPGRRRTSPRLLNKVYILKLLSMDIGSIA